MKLVMINIYPDGTAAKYLLSSYVLLAYLKEHLPNYDELGAEVLNFGREVGIADICGQIVNKNPDCVAYSCYTWNIDKVQSIIRLLQHTMTRVVHILGGPEISSGMSMSCPPTIYHIIGEGERKFSLLISNLMGEDACHRYTSSITDLDTIPSVYLSGVLPDHLYSRQQAMLETQRGCRYRCRYCVYHKHLPSIRYYSEERIIEELDYLIIQKQVMAIRILDAVFTSDLPRAKRIVRHLVELKDKGIRLPWIYWEFTYQDVDEEFISLVSSLKQRERILNTAEVAPLDRPQLYSDLLKDYTAISSVGIQSFNKQSLKAVRRAKVDMVELGAFMDMAKKHNIVLKLDIILGLPFETFDTYFQALEEFIPYFEDTDHILNIHLLSILPGSELGDLCEKYEIEYDKEAPYLALSTNGFSKEELSYASKLSAVLFRILNSPLRGRFFAVKRCTEYNFLYIIAKILDRINNIPEFRDTRIVCSEYVDDEYWNGDIYQDIPSEWLIGVLQGVLEYYGH